MKPTSAQVEYAMMRVKTLFENDFYKAISYQKDGKVYYLGCFDWCEDHRNWLKEQDLFILNGETKVCIIDAHLEDWVIKIGIRQNPQSWARYMDYMVLEAEYYEEAKNAHLEGFFAETYKIGKIEDVDIILQEFACPDENKISDFFFTYAKSTIEYSPEEYESEDEYLDAVSCIEEEMDTEERVKAIFGERAEYNDLIEFIEENEINDLHSGNWGTTKDGRVVIFDFSGYYG